MKTGSGQVGELMVDGEVRRNRRSIRQMQLADKFFDIAKARCTLSVTTCGRVSDITSQ